MRVLILGVTGQDGLILANKMYARSGVTVFGTTRRRISDLDVQLSLPLSQSIKCIQLDPENKHEVISLISQIKPDQIFLFAGQSSVGRSFQEPHETISSAALIVINVLEAVRLENPKCKVFNAASSECFGETLDTVATEDTEFNPQSPYALSKSISIQIARSYRDQYGIFVSNGLLFNHESSLRGQNFVIKKIMRAVLDFKNGNSTPVGFGKLDIKRDWGFAPEFVDAMVTCLLIDDPQDFIVATGKVGKLSDLLDSCFSFYGLNWTEKVFFDRSLSRKNEPLVVAGNPQKALRVLFLESRDQF